MYQVPRSKSPSKDASSDACLAVRITAGLADSSQGVRGSGEGCNRCAYYRHLYIRHLCSTATDTAIDCYRLL